MILDMRLSVTQVRKSFGSVLCAAEIGGEIAVTRRGKDVACIAPASRRKGARLGMMKERIRLLPGWDAPVGFVFADDARFVSLK
jgi:antitoxin (DNA-binding transcriptional repressor) of toxin-antitoxin stability system